MHLKLRYFFIVSLLEKIPDTGTKNKLSLNYLTDK